MWQNNRNKIIVLFQICRYRTLAASKMEPLEPIVHSFTSLNVLANIVIKSDVAYLPHRLSHSLSIYSVTNTARLYKHDDHSRL